MSHENNQGGSDGDESVSTVSEHVTPGGIYYHFGCCPSFLTVSLLSISGLRVKCSLVFFCLFILFNLHLLFFAFKFQLLSRFCRCPYIIVKVISPQGLFAVVSVCRHMYKHTCAHCDNMYSPCSAAHVS